MYVPGSRYMSWTCNSTLFPQKNDATAEGQYNTPDYTHYELPAYSGAAPKGHDFTRELRKVSIAPVCVYTMRCCMTLCTPRSRPPATETHTHITYSLTPTHTAPRPCLRTPAPARSWSLSAPCTPSASLSVPSFRFSYLNARAPTSTRLSVNPGTTAKPSFPPSCSVLHVLRERQRTAVRPKYTATSARERIYL